MSRQHEEALSLNQRHIMAQLLSSRVVFHFLCIIIMLLNDGTICNVGKWAVSELNISKDSQCEIPKQSQLR